MKAIPLELTLDVVSSYNQLKTTVAGRAAKRTLSALQGGKTVVGSPLNGFADTTSDAAVTPARVTVSHNNHALYLAASNATGLAVFALYDVNELTGEQTYVGKIQCQFPSATHTQRFGRIVNDTTNTGWRILFGSIGTVAANGGLFSVENVDKADFVQGTPTLFPAASAGGGGGQKAVYWHQETGGVNNLQVMQGGGHEFDCELAGQRVVIVNGLVATPNVYVFNFANAITTVAAGGITTDCFVLKTPTITGWIGTFLLLNNFSICVPDASSGAPVALQGETCLFIPTSTNMGLAKVSDFTSISTTIPSYTTRDVNDVAQTNVALTPTTMHFSQTLQRIVFSHSSGGWVVKKFMNAEYENTFGNSSNPQYRTLQPIAFKEFGIFTLAASYIRKGWIYQITSTVGQIGAVSFDLRSIYHYDYSYVISKVIDVSGLTFVGIEPQIVTRSPLKIFYRLSGFGSASGGWIELPADRDMSSIVNTTGQIQFKFQSNISRSSNTVPTQIIEAYLFAYSINEISDYWEFSKDKSDSGVPTKYVFRQKKLFNTTVPTLYVRAQDLSNNSISGSPFNSVTHAAQFRYSIDNGSNWTPFGTPPDAIGTLIEFTFITPPGVDNRPSMRES